MIVCEVKTSPPQEFKVDLEERTFEGYAAAYGNVDQGGDRLLYGSGKHIADANPSIPIFYGHGWTQNERPIGKSLYFEEREEGLFTKGKIFDVPTNQDILVGMKEKILGCLSIGWKPTEKKTVREDGQTIREVSKWDLQEYSVLPNGFAMNPQALITAMKGGRVVIMAGVDEDKLDLTDENIPTRDYRELREFVEKADPISLLLDEATYLNELTKNLSAEGREEEVRQALAELNSAALLLKGICAMNDLDPGEADLVALIRKTTEKIHEASKTLTS
ncbi:MAG: HK97 family phage prohead protease [bacterium]